MLSRPSGSMMNRLVPCPGSLKLCSEFPEEPGDNQDADKGSTAHWVAADCMTSHRRPEFWLDKTPVNNQVVDVEMVEHVSNYKSMLLSLFESGIQSNCVEKRLEIEGFGGTPDYLFHDHTVRKVTVVDLKYGFGIVDVFENWQLISYLWLWWMNNRDLPVIDVEFVIYQPRPYHPDGAVRKWSVTLDNLVMNYFPRIVETLTNVRMSDALTTVGFHCRYCSAMLHCRVNLETCLNIIDVTGVNSAGILDNQTLGRQLAMFEYAQEILKQRVNVLKTVAESRLSSGENIPDYAMVPSGAHRSWKMSDKMAKILGVPHEKPKLMTPRQAELTGFPKSLVESNTVTKSKMKLTKVDVAQRALQLFGKSEKLR